MLPIYICEDNPTELKLIENLVRDYLIMNQVDNTYKIISFTNPLNFINKYKKEPQTAIYLIDCNLNNTINGTELASQIRELDPIGYIVFISAQKEYIPLALRAQVNTLDFIIKNTTDFKQRLFNVLDSAFKIYASYTAEEKDIKNYFFVNCGGKTIPIKYSDIIYIEASHKPHKLVLSATNMYVEFYGSLDKTLKILNSSLFFRCNRSVLINLNYIDSIDKRNKKVILKNQKAFAFTSLKELKKLTP